MNLLFFKNYFGKNFRYDFLASIVVFLVGLPLCLGIAQASGAPMFSGIITGVLAGILVTALSGSEVSISGPAAGLTIFVAAAIAKTGSYETFLCAVILCGVFQLLFSVMNLGFLAVLFPNSVIKGVLVGIGLTILVKQAPYALGGFSQFESEIGFFDWMGHNNTFSVLLNSIASLKISALLITILGLLTLKFWESKTIKEHTLLSQIPGAVVVVFMAVVINILFKMGFPSLALHAADGHLLQLPEFHSWEDLKSHLYLPNFEGFKQYSTWVSGITLATVASIETLLCLESIDRFDPLRRASNSNRELLAQGVGNFFCGLIGGVPMASVIVRSSANIYTGARTRAAGFFSGVILLISILFLGSILNLIPVAALATILLAVGYKLAHPKAFKRMYQAGSDQFLPFLFTAGAILFIDLLRGILIGIFVGICFVIRSNVVSAITIVRDGKDILIRFNKDLNFVHKVPLKKELSQLEPGSRVYIDGSRAHYIDRDVYEMIQEFQASASERNVSIELKEVSIKRVPITKKSKAKAKEKRNGIL